LKIKRFYIITMGCQMNVYDSSQMERRLASEGYVPCGEPEQADLIIINTCAIREKPEHKVHSHLGRLVRIKKKRPDIVIAVGGCVAQHEGQRLVKRWPWLDLVFGPFAVRRLPELVTEALRRDRCVVDVDTNSEAEPGEIAPAAFQCGSPTGFVTIMQGCDNYCTYCIVPYVRGREVSRRPERIVSEVEYLVASGVKEVTLLGQNVNSYGMTNGHACTFPELLATVNRVNGLKRLRFTTSHPKDLSEGLIACFDGLDTLAPHIHLPVQSGSTRVLKRMNRGYGREAYLRKIESLRRVRSDIAITSDIIVGFPGEDDKAFRETLDLLQAVEFDNLFSFKYSDRKGVPASRFSRKVEENEKEDRLARLQEIQSAITLRKHQALVGTCQEVLVEGRSKRGRDQLTGHTPCNKTVNFSGAASEVGGIVPVKITAAFSHSLRGEMPRRCERLPGRQGGVLHAA
jgi:tRNA-2-methylthio-N6-dimethylallyladenosine synthase